MEFVYSQNGEKLLIVDKYKFFYTILQKVAKKLGIVLIISVKVKFTQIIQGWNYWKTCSSNIHNHDEDTTLNGQEVNNSLKRKVSEDNFVEKLSKFILTEIKNLNNENNLNTTDFNYIRRNVYNAHKSILPPWLKS